MGVLQHFKDSLIIDGVDPTQIQPSDWDAPHPFAGGTNGQIFVRDTTDSINGAKWTSSPLVASLLFGTMAAPVSPSDGEVWVEASGTFGVDRVIKIMVRDGGVSYPIVTTSVP